MSLVRFRPEAPYADLAHLVERNLAKVEVAGSSPVIRSNKKALLSYDKSAFLSDAFLSERDAHYVRDAGFARDARLRRVGRTHRITDHSAAAALITYLQILSFYGIIYK